MREKRRHSGRCTQCHAHVHVRIYVCKHAHTRTHTQVWCATYISRNNAVSPLGQQGSELGLQPPATLERGGEGRGRGGERRGGCKEE